MFWERLGKVSVVQSAASWHNNFWSVCQFLNDHHDTITWEKRTAILYESATDVLVRMFDPISRIDVRRAVWTLCNRPGDCAPLFEKLVQASEFLLLDSYIMLLAAYGGKELLVRFGQGLWSVSCHSPS